jgi:hypothetical protein
VIVARFCIFSQVLSLSQIPYRPSTGLLFKLVNGKSLTAEEMQRLIDQADSDKLGKAGSGSCRRKSSEGQRKEINPHFSWFELQEMSRRDGHFKPMQSGTGGSATKVRVVSLSVKCHVIPCQVIAIQVKLANAGERWAPPAHLRSRLSRHRRSVSGRNSLQRQCGPASGPFYWRIYNRLKVADLAPMRGRAGTLVAGVF